MPRPTALLKRALIFVHRWLGVALSVIFALWFVSGIVMMYWSFPGVAAQDRLQHAPSLKPEHFAVSAEDAYAALGRDEPASQVRVTSFDGRPVYQFGGGGRGGRAGAGPLMVYADNGTPQGSVAEAMVDRAAEAWAGRPLTEARKESVEDADQWTVGSALRTLRPLYEYTWPDGQQVYVNGRTAEVVQDTTTASRFWAYLGAIPHWLYFTPLRKHQPQWFAFVVWSSLICTITALMGVVVAIWMFSPRQRYRHAGAPTSIPYRGWKRWHTIIGLFFGVVTTTWAFSGLLSMGPFPIVDKLTALTVPADPAATAARAEGERAAVGRGGRAGSGPNIAGALRGSGRFQLSSYASKTPAAAIASVSGFEVKELEYTTFAGEPVYLAMDSHGNSRIIPVSGEPKASFDAEDVMRIVRTAAGDKLAELRIADEYDAYYLDRRGQRPLPVVYARLNDAASTRFYIDPKTGRVAGTYSSRGWVNRWLYHGLHSLDFPWLYKHRPLWDILVITLMLGGTALCVTSLVLTWRVLMRKIVVKPMPSLASEDLT